jgi:molybdopterin molybdotransferase
LPDSFLKLMHLPAAVRLLLESLPGPVPRTEHVALEDALGRVVADDVFSPEDLPGFNRSSMDGYAVKAADTFGASEGLPAYLELSGEVLMGRSEELEVRPGKALRISTGGFMPGGADAVVMVEHTELSDSTVEIVRSVAPGENTIGRDEDIAAGALLIGRGQLLGAAQIGALAGVGIAAVRVYALPVVGIISTGDELVDATVKPGPGQVRDVNTTALAASVAQAGCVARAYGLVEDDFDRLLAASRKALEECDALLISGGSSAGVRDMTLVVLEALGKPGVLAHGIYLKPGKPTLIAVCDGKPAIGLPGNPASALAVFRELLEPALAKLRGEVSRPSAGVARTVEAVIDRSVSSLAGRVELVPVSLRVEGEGLVASPILGKSNLIGTLSRAQGQVRVPLGVEGLEQGQSVTVELLD